MIDPHWQELSIDNCPLICESEDTERLSPPNISAATESVAPNPTVETVEKDFPTLMAPFTLIELPNREKSWTERVPFTFNRS
jgi:hypothetical protein